MIIQGNDPFTASSFTYRNRLARLAWAIVYTMFFRFTPRAMHAWRNVLLRAFGAQLGQHVHIHGTARIWAPWNLCIADYVGVGEHVNIYNMALLDVGSYAVISQGTHLCAGSHDFNSQNFQLFAKPISIGAHTWICADAFVGPGVTIAEGCVLGARGVLMKSIATPWTVWAGNPAEMKGSRTRSTSK